VAQEDALEEAHGGEQLLQEDKGEELALWWLTSSQGLRG
jgi:hypothetical protein